MPPGDPLSAERRVICWQHCWIPASMPVTAVAGPSWPATPPAGGPSPSPAASQRTRADCLKILTRAVGVTAAPPREAGVPETDKLSPAARAALLRYLDSAGCVPGAGPFTVRSAAVAARTDALVAATVDDLDVRDRTLTLDDAPPGRVGPPGRVVHILDPVTLLAVRRWLPLRAQLVSDAVTCELSGRPSVGTTTVSAFCPPGSRCKPGACCVLTRPSSTGTTPTICAARTPRCPPLCARSPERCGPGGPRIGADAPCRNARDVSGPRGASRSSGRRKSGRLPSCPETLPGSRLRHSGVTAAHHPGPTGTRGGPGPRAAAPLDRDGGGRAAGLPARSGRGRGRCSTTAGSPRPAPGRVPGR